MGFRKLRFASFSDGNVKHALESYAGGSVGIHAAYVIVPTRRSSQGANPSNCSCLLQLRQFAVEWTEIEDSARTSDSAEATAQGGYLFGSQLRCWIDFWTGSRSNALHL